LKLNAGADAPPLAPMVRFGTGLTDIEKLDAARLLAAASRQRVNGPDIHFGPPGKKTTALVRVRNAGTTQGSWIFTTGRGSLKYFRMYELNGGGLQTLVDGSDPEAASDNLLTYQAFSSELVLDPGQEKLLVIDFVSENSTYLPLKIQTYGTFFKDRRVNIAMVSAVVFGAIVLIFLNMLFFSISGHREFVWLAIAQAFFAVNTIHSEGYLTIFFLSNHPLTSVALEDFFKCGFAAAMAQFGRSFVKTRAYFPHRDAALRLLIAAALAIMLVQPALSLYPSGLRQFLHAGAWLVAVSVALFLPFVGYAAMQLHGRQLWPLFVGWASLAIFIVYAAIASMGIFEWLPINWHLAGPVGLFEALMVTVALGLHLRKIQADKLAGDARYAQSMAERVRMSEAAARLAEEKATALATVNSQNALLHASGHDSKQVILALNSAIEVLGRDDDGRHADTRKMLQSSAEYLGQIVSTTISGATIGGEAGFLALSAFRGAALVDPLVMMFKTTFGQKKLTLTSTLAGDLILLSDRPLLTRALANLLSNAYQYSDTGGAHIALNLEDGRAIIDVVDTGVGMPANLVQALSREGSSRPRAGSEIRGSGSGYRAARQIVAALGGSLKILSSGPDGTHIRATLPNALECVTPCTVRELQMLLPGWELLDFDNRVAFETAIVASDNPRRWIAAITYDDTTITRGRLSSEVGMMLLKPLALEFRDHPLLQVRSEQS